MDPTCATAIPGRCRDRSDEIFLWIRVGCGEDLPPLSIQEPSARNWEPFLSPASGRCRVTVGGIRRDQQSLQVVIDELSDSIKRDIRRRVAGEDSWINGVMTLPREHGRDSFGQNFLDRCQDSQFIIY